MNQVPLAGQNPVDSVGQIPTDLGHPQTLSNRRDPRDLYLTRRQFLEELQVDDTDRYYREWSSKVDVSRPPKDEEWGARTFDLLDPSGNTIFVMGPVTNEK
jgi:hypothetical protein